ncbi:MAG TPA: NADH-quinone oxidoreductase subunit NuoG [Acidimicrobiales bacterium]|nr:NADH-quinone oxidoreductase subunit NuoG [Acidimicrobiales bacterium]
MAEPKGVEVTINLDGREVKAREGEVIIAAAERAGVYVPRFCYHPRMKPVGMCRMCLVDVTGPRGPMLVPACFIEVAEGQEIFTDTPRVKKAQDGVLEFLLVNHPLDCPVCDKGGECPLQDQTLAFGPGETRFVEEKRHFEKPIPLSPLVLLDRERCIQCARCTRFADEIAGDPLIDFFNRGERTEVATYPDHPFASYFSGNTVQICPVGALTAVPYRFKARPWDLEQVESTCTVCSVGCRMAVQSSANKLTRYIGLDSEPVNHSWLCDKGRFSFEAVNNEGRLTSPQVRKSGELIDVVWGEALDAAATAIREARDRFGAGSVAVLGGARLANEDAYAWTKLAKGVIGTDSVDAQLGDGLPAELVLGVPRATIEDACNAPAIVLLAPDLKEELPVLYLRLRAAAVERGVPIIEIAPRATGLTKYARAHLGYRPGEVAAVVAALLSGSSADVGPVTGADFERARPFLSQPGVVIVAGRPSLAEPAGGVADAIAALVAGLPDARVLPALRRGNVLGALDMGMAPGVLPGRVSLDDGRHWFDQEWGVVPEERGNDALGILAAAAEGKVQALILLGADPMADAPDRELARRALSGAGTVIGVDLFATASLDHADVLLPAAAFAERPGTTTNIEGRVARLGQKLTPPGVAWPDWMIAAELAARLGGGFTATTIDDLTDEIQRLAPSHHGLTRAVLGSRNHRDGVVVPLDPSVEAASAPIAASDVGAHDPQGSSDPIDPAATPGLLEVEEHGVPVTALAPGEGAAPDADSNEGVERPPLLTYTSPPGDAVVPPHDAYSLRLVSSRSLYDNGTMTQHAPSMAGLAGDVEVHVNPYDLERLGVRSGGSVRLIGRTRIVANVVADERVPRGNAFVAFNTAGLGAADLIDASLPANDVRMETP